MLIFQFMLEVNLGGVGGFNLNEQHKPKFGRKFLALRDVRLYLDLLKS